MPIRNFSKSPLFKNASSGTRQQVRREFQRTKAGRLAKEIIGAYRAGSSGNIAHLMRSRGPLTQSELIRSVRGMDIGRVAMDVAKYAKGGSSLASRVAQDFLKELGPIGKLLAGIAQGVQAGSSTRGIRSELATALNFLDAFADDEPEVLDRMKEILESRGYKVTGPAGRQAGGPSEPSRRSDAIDLPFGIPGRTQAGTQRKVVDIPVTTGKKQRFPIDHPIVSGAMVPAPQSSNVHSYGYDIENEQLYVRFKAPAPKGQKTRPNQPGSLYQYSDVDPSQFLRLHRASSKGTWVWDELRIRGTVSGHQRSYRLVGITMGYVPRMATLRPDGEWFVQRSIRGRGGKRLTSSRPDQLVRRLSPTGAPNTGAPSGPNRGTPNRGTPNRGR